MLVQCIVLTISFLAVSGASFPSSATGNSKLATIPTQIIIEFTEQPAAQQPRVAAGHGVATSADRVAAAASASAPAVAQQKSFRTASTHIAYKSNHVYTHVRSLYLRQSVMPGLCEIILLILCVG